MIPGCAECYGAIMQANQLLRTEGESWLVSNDDGHNHIELDAAGKATRSGRAYVVHLVDTAVH